MLRLAIGLIFIVVPMIELMLLIKLGQAVGVWPTMALVVSTALAGAFIISRQSLTLLNRTLEALSEGRPPVEPVLDGLFLMVAGALLLTPGLATDVVALALLVPPLRRAIARASMRWMLRRVPAHVETYTQAGASRRRSSGSPRPDAAGGGPVIDVDFERLDERPVEPRRNAGPGPDA